jgi:hypothetical protein
MRYRAQAAPSSVTLCHCRSCRLASGAPSVGWVVVPKRHFCWLAGELSTFRSSPAVVRGFCGGCGTPLTYEHEDAPEDIELTLATLSSPDLAPTREIWLSEKLPWVTINPSLGHFRRGSPDE